MNNNLDKQYQALLQDILDNGIKKSDRTGTGTISVFGRQIRHKMSEGFPLLTTKKMYFKGIATELLWFLRGDTNIKYLVDNDCHIWDGDAYKRFVIETKKQFGNDFEVLSKEQFIESIKADSYFAKKWGELGPLYGKQWRNWECEKVVVNDGRVKEIESYEYKQIDQITNLINDLKINPDSRRLMVNAWNVGEIDQMVLPPCHYGFQVYTRELSFDERHWLYCKSFEGTNDNHKGSSNNEQMIEYHNNRNIPKRAISLMYNARSQDVPLGTPFNLASYGLLLEIIAKMVNMIPDELITNMGDCHIYLNQIEGIKEQLTKEPFELPSLRINTEFWSTRAGECGKGPLSDNISFIIDNMSINDFQIKNYKSHPAIKIPLSN